MAKKIRNLKDGTLEKVDVLDIQIVKQVSEEFYIVGDGNDYVLLISDQKMVTGSAYRLIKPNFSDMTLKKNPKFAAIKMEKKISMKPLKKEEEDILCVNVTNYDNSLDNKIENDFGLVNSLGVGGISDEIKLMVVRRSNPIQGKFGNYRIVTCKDIKNQKNSVNLYRNLLDLVKVGEVYNFTKLKVNNYKKEDEEFNRIGTTISSRITKASSATKQEFEKANVRLGDHVTRGSIIGISQLNIYQSCKVCWCKVDGDDICRKCDKKAESTKTDFNLVMYVQSDDQEDEIVEIFCFNSTLNLKNLTEITEENLNKIMMEKKCEAEYDDDEGKLKLVKFHMLSS